MSEFKTPDLPGFGKKEKTVQPPPLNQESTNISEESNINVDNNSSVIKEPPTEDSLDKPPSTDNNESSSSLLPSAENKKDQKSSRERDHQQLIDAAKRQEKYNAIISGLKYREPLGAALADSRYSLEVLKSGAIVDQINFKHKKFFIVGRVPGCDIVAENPTISRMHAILQFIDGNYKSNNDSQKKDGENGNSTEDSEVETQVREKGLYLYDLDSTHGTYLNKNRLFPNKFYRLRVGHVIKFGNSGRLYVVGGPDEDEEEEDEKTVTELQKEKLEKEFERKKLAEQMDDTPREEPKVEDEGISWGMPEDAEEEADLRENPFAMDFGASDVNFDNPKKTLRGWYEREGYELEYDVRDKANGTYICRIDLPLDGPDNGKVFAEVELKGKKKDCVHQCAIQACKILDKYGVLRQSHHESKAKKKTKDWQENDYYSSDEDTFLDRTGTVEKKREKRMMEAGKIQQQTETYDSLLAKDNAFQEEIDTIKQKIDQAERKSQQDEDEIDPLDAFMTDLKTGVSDLKKLKTRLRELNAEQAKNKKLLHIAKPALPKIESIPTSLPPSSSNKLTNSQDKSSSPSSEVKDDLKKSHVTEKPLFGPRIQFKISKSTSLVSTSKDKTSIELEKPCDKVKEIEEYEEEKEEEEEAEEEEEQVEKPVSKRDNTSRKRPMPTIIAESTMEVEHDDDDNDDDDDDENELDEDGGSSLREETNNKSSKSKKRKRVRQQFKKEVKYDYDASREDYETWVPPKNQDGSGRTSLNEKLGY